MHLEAGRTRREEAKKIRNLQCMRLDPVPGGCNGEVDRVKLIINYLASKGFLRDGKGSTNELANHFGDFLEEHGA